MSCRWWIVGCVVLGIGLLLCGGGGAAGLLWWRSQPYTHEQFNARFLGATPGEVRLALGSPDLVSTAYSIGQREDGNDGYWLYTKRTFNAATNAIDPQVYVWFTNGRCDRIDFH